jgi:hypothetical protein
MTEDIIEMARDAGFTVYRDEVCFVEQRYLERFAALVAAAERNKLAAWMIHHNLATGHGDTMEQLCDALGTEIVHRIDMEVESEREACAKLIESHKTGANELMDAVREMESRAIRARGQA